MSQSIPKTGSSLTTDVKALEDARASGNAQQAKDAQQRIDTHLDTLKDTLDNDAHLSPEQKRKLEGEVTDFRRIVDDPKTSSNDLDKAMLAFIEDLRRR
jgi:hypothetical protein